MYINYARETSESAKKLSAVALGLIIAGCSIFGIAVIVTIIICCYRPGLFNELQWGWHGVTIESSAPQGGVAMKPSSKGVVRPPPSAHHQASTYTPGTA
ncbi:hypothetical protein ACI3LY_001903 [Candidozyma auris]|uniref:Uncharacterized protein n=2 Tax=Candidozyma auris TaxID=498019 RepID=A0A2H0ZK21_CANAR|nr:hypothetical protein QG37_07276 [[Candida] auris]PIS51021.1 hypothetical protein B9J08_002591 [[Candida] auris]PIS52988.1 hypothetical protein CJI97_002645 [[Candida] auris]